MNSLLSQRKIINIEITEDGIVRLYEFEKNEENLGEDEWKQYREEVGWLSEKVEALWSMWRQKYDQGNLRIYDVSYKFIFVDLLDHEMDE